MSYKEDDPNTHKYLPKFSVDEWIKFRRRLRKMHKKHIPKSERDYRILEELIVNMRTTAELASLARTNESYDWLKSNQKKPISTRRIQQILIKYFPEFKIKTTHKQDKPHNKIRHEQRKLRQQIITKDSACVLCGVKEKLELHHMIPVALGGDNDDRNIIILCRNCHRTITIYDLMIINKKKAEEKQNSTQK